MLSNFLVSQGSFVAKTSPTGSGILPTGSTAQRDGSPSSGYIRFNSDDTAFEGYNGSAWSAIGGGAVSGIVGISTFTSSGTWTKATRESALGVTIKRVIVEVQGAGGSGAKRNGGYVGPGAAGGYSKKLIDVSSISSATVTVGTGGAAVTATSTPGNSGGSSSWSDGTNTITCGGGSGGDGTTTYYSVVGGTATGGDINIPGGDSTFGRNSGRDSMFGFGGPDSQASANFIGGSSPDARGYGAGGSPTYLDTSGAGGDGIVIVTEIAG